MLLVQRHGLHGGENMIGRIIKNSDHFEFCELDDLEITLATKELASINVATFTNIFKLTRLFLKEREITVTNQQLINIALAIFDKCAVQSYPVLKTALARKVSNTKEEARYDQQRERNSVNEQYPDVLREQSSASKVEESQ